MVTGGSAATTRSPVNHRATYKDKQPLTLTLIDIVNVEGKHFFFLNYFLSVCYQETTESFFMQDGFQQRESSPAK